MTVSSGDMVAAAKAATQTLLREPRLKTAIVTCMDTRIDPLRVLGSVAGELHILRNAGGIVTDDVLRSLVISQRALGTNRIRVVMHTDCGMLGLDDEQMAAKILAETGAEPRFRFGGFHDLEDELRRAVERLHADPLLRSDHVEGLVYDVIGGSVKRVV